MLALTLAVVGAGAGLVPLASVTSVQPTDSGGGLTPAWVIKAYAAMLAAVAAAAPVVVLLVIARLGDTGWLGWSAVPVAGILGTLLAVLLTRAASRRLRDKQLEIVAALEPNSGPTAPEPVPDRPRRRVAGGLRRPRLRQ